MSDPSSGGKKSNVNRRRFLQASGATAAAVTLSQAPLVHAGGSDILRVGLVGCGGRGTGAATQALRADRNVRLVALGDAFRDRVDRCLGDLRRDNAIADKLDVPRERQFVGFDAYRQVINAVDVVLLCTPPHFRPIHIEEAVRRRKHIFCEKPMAVDGPGVRRVLASARKARHYNLSLVSGFCWRYHQSMRDLVGRLHDGAIGDINAIQTSYNTGTLWHADRRQGMSDMEWQMRNWLYFTWLSGDFIVEQHVHSLDKVGWIMQNQYPVKAVGLGGRQVRTGSEFGHIFDHHAVVYEYANGTRVFSYCRQQARCANDVSEHIFGTQGRCNIKADTLRFEITGSRPWTCPPAEARRHDMYQTEHNELFASIRNGRPMNDGDWMAKSTLMAIMGRMATYSGQEITWQQALTSQRSLSPARYEWGDLAVPEVARPGATENS